MNRVSSAVPGAALMCAMLLAGCSSATDPDGVPPSSSDPPSGTGAATSTGTPSPQTSPGDAGSASSSASSATTDTPPSAPPPSVRFRSGAALRHVRTLAGDIGPRLATGPGYREAGALVGSRLTELGYTVERQRFPVPAGDSWGVPVDAGRSFNVVATPPGFDPTEPHRLVGAHLDTIAVAPGAEDNASGVAVLLEVARLAAAEPPPLPTVLVAFGAEEPRGPGDDLHHFGSRHYVQQMRAAERESLLAMVSLDRVGVGSTVPVCTGPLSPPRVRDAILATAQRQGIPAHACENTASDHWSFEKAGFPVARLGSTSYPAYHSADDLPAVVDRAQLGRVGRLTWSWLQDGP